MSDWSDSDSEKENYDDSEPPKKRQKTKTPLFCKREAPLQDGISRRNGEYFKGIWQRTRSGQFQIFGSEWLHEMSVALWVRI